jgi:hypothetical protein
LENSTGDDASASQNFDSAAGYATPIKKVGEQVGAVGAQAGNTAQELIGEIAAEGASATAEIKDSATATVEQRKETLADRIEEVSDAVRKSGEQLEGHQDIVAQLIEKGADELGTLALTLRSNDLQGLLGNIGSLARRQPALFTGMSIAAGFALTRIGKMAVAGATRDDLPKLPEVSNEHR